MTKASDWDETLADLARRRSHTRAMGGPERVAKHHANGKLDARARLDRLLDAGSFRELGTLVGGDIAADGIVVGSGAVNGSPVMVGAEDFTTLAGSIGPGGNSKRYRIAELALRHRVPLVMLLEGAGFGPPAATTAAPRPTCWPRRTARARYRPWPRCLARPPGTAHWSPRCATSAS